MKPKFIIKDIKETDERIEIAVAVASNQRCKTCGVNERRDGSSYCKECSNLYKQSNA